MEKNMRNEIIDGLGARVVAFCFALQEYLIVAKIANNINIS